MSDKKYHFNPESLSYDKVELSLKQKIVKKVVPQIIAGFVIAFMLFIAFSYWVDSGREKKMKRENKELEQQYIELNKKFDQLDRVLEDLKRRDNNIYRAIFESEPPEVNKEYGDAEYFKKLEGLSNKKLIADTRVKINSLHKQIKVQAENFSVLLKTVNNKEKRKILAHIPAIQPIENSKLQHIPYGYGMRIDPVYKTPTFHYGMDYAATKGTKIFATANGIVQRTDRKSRKFGKYVKINHGYGYHTLYAHMSKIAVRSGQKVKRGDVIGYVGDTGKSITPHIHYEVHRNGKPVNPINFYFGNLSPNSYAKLIVLLSMSGQALD